MGMSEDGWPIGIGERRTKQECRKAVKRGILRPFKGNNILTTKPYKQQKRLHYNSTSLMV